MPALSGQALRLGGRLCSLLLRLAMALLLLAGLGLGALSWRLSQGPLHVPLLTRAVEQLIARANLQRNVEVEDIVLAWDGFRDGAAAPLSVHVSGLRVRDEAGALRHELPDVAVSLSLPRLLAGQVVPGTVTLWNPRIVLERDAAGQVSLAMGHLAGSGAEDQQGGRLLGQLLGTGGEEGALSALRSIEINGGSLTILDRQMNLTWRLQNVALALRRAGAAIESEGTAQLLLPGQGGEIPVRLTGRVSGTGPRLEGRLVLPALEPARLAQLMPALAPLGLLDAAVALEVEGVLDGALREPPHLALALRVGAGSVALRPGQRIAFAGLELRAGGTPEALRLERMVLTLPARPAGHGVAAAGPVITATGQAALREGRWRGGVELSLSRLEATELGAYWPPEVSPHAREWLVQNLTAGTLSAGRFNLAAESAEDLSGFVLKEAGGSLRLERGTVHWLRPVPPMENIAANIRLGLKEVVVQVEAGRQSGTALATPATTVRLFALDTDAEQMEITGRLRGPVSEAVALIRHPRLKLFEKRPLDLREPGGQLDATLRLALPLLVDIPDEAIQVSVQAKLTALRLADVVAGQRLENGTAELTVDKARLRARGTAQLGGIPTRLAVEMDFRPGPASQVVERITANAQTPLAALERFGLDLEGLAEGPAGIEAVMVKPRSGEARVSFRADLRDATMTLDPLAWRKPPGQPANARAELRLAGETLRGLENLRVEAPGLSLRGGGGFTADNRLERLQIAEASVGNSRFSGEVRPPLQPGAAWQVRLQGPVLDLAPVLAARDPARAEPPPLPATPAAADFLVEAQFERVLLGEGRFIADLRGELRADAAGVPRQARLAGQVAGTAPVEVAVTPRGAGRDLVLTSGDAGALLRSFDVLQQVHGGRLSVHGHWANNRADAVLSGTAELDDFSVLDAPAVGKLLQALTVYGVFDAIQGPGLSFSRLVAPFSLSPRTLTVREARAFSASLGVTASGELDRQRRVVAMEGTLVPAYMLNTLLGRLPLIGRLFSPEQGGGLFAAAFQVSGGLDDPRVSVNPLSMLTPGFLRGLFGSSRPVVP